MGHTIAMNFLSKSTYISTQPLSPIISIALWVSPADRYISAAALGSLMFRAQSAFFLISAFRSTLSPEPKNSCGMKKLKDFTLRKIYDV